MRLLIFRTILIYFSVLIAMRLMGKRQLGELQPAELVSTILISNLASISIESADVPLAASLVPLYLITAIEILDSVLCLKFPRYAQLTAGRPKAVIRDGVIDQQVLSELRLGISDLLEALRGKDIFDLRDVSYAVMETNGCLNVAKRPRLETVTREDVAIAPDADKATVPFIVDGKILPDNLRWCGKSVDWLEKAALQNGTRPADILVALGNEGEQIFWIKKANHPTRGGSQKGPAA